MQTETATRRETIRSRTSMSYAFEAALQPYLHVASDAASELAVMVAGAVVNGYRTRPAWTVSKRAEAPTKGRRKGARR